MDMIFLCLKKILMGFVMNKFILLMLVGMVSCAEYKKETVVSKVEAVSKCTNATDGNAWSDNPQKSRCRVRLENKKHITLDAPVMVGESVTVELVKEKSKDGWIPSHYFIISRQ